MRYSIIVYADHAIHLVRKMLVGVPLLAHPCQRLDPLNFGFLILLDGKGDARSEEDKAPNG
jgi:hypothetical protein